jgi:hypothetical protein
MFSRKIGINTKTATKRYADVFGFERQHPGRRKYYKLTSFSPPTNFVLRPFHTNDPVTPGGKVTLPETLLPEEKRRATEIAPFTVGRLATMDSSAPGLGAMVTVLNPGLAGRIPATRLK